MRLLVVFSILAALLVSASLSMTHVFPMSEMSGTDCGVGLRCIQTSGSPLVDCLEHCLGQQIPSSPVTPMVFDWSVLLLIVAFASFSFPNFVRSAVLRSGRDAPFGLISRLLQLRTVEIKS
jgi:hypothetical protein